ncbi:LysM peptidoglycan-binding domain-containing protein [Sporosalibacterium faouarense]|uniref:LysM peptidoglycan-binding domain-containing protein n=1 Tax=Sporosalibacterium faouarense TaxID=516123 RepID=UPI00141CDE2C|nr:LysM peptidoglycan-binding domain-containing protein [Sporosalibacterium faouarense]MTI49588.1 LysM peptidoglycan-binding domain-containing protein [Bacillota bacterium]
MNMSTDYLDGKRIYVVQKEDTLEKIANKHNTTIDFILSMNPYLIPNNLEIGQNLYVPENSNWDSCPKGTMPYIIQEGDSLCQIALKFNISIHQIMESNPMLNPYGIYIGQSICIPKTWDVYSNDSYNVSFMFPANWKHVELERYEGENGFFQVAAIGSRRSLRSVYRHECYSKNRNYGNNPKFITTDIEGQSACLIYPSEDQNSSMNNIAALIVEYPKPINLENRVYNYLILWASKGYIRQMGSTMSFLVY